MSHCLRTGTCSGCSRRGGPDCLPVAGTSSIRRVFHSGGMACHLVRYQIVAGRPPPREPPPHLVPNVERRMEDQGSRADWPIIAPTYCGGPAAGAGYRLEKPPNRKPLAKLRVAANFG